MPRDFLESLPLLKSSSFRLSIQTLSHDREAALICAALESPPPVSAEIVPCSVGFLGPRKPVRRFYCAKIKT